jgi:hypothetical protein
VSPDAVQTSGGSSASSGSSAVTQPPPAAPAATTPRHRSPVPTLRPEPIRREGAPARPVTHRWGERAGRVLAAATSADAAPAALAGLALLLVAIASGSLLLVTRSHATWRRA